MDPRDDVPAHLREFVVRQDYGQYTEEDQAVWRFVLLQTHAQLLRTAHPSYPHGFAGAGIAVDRIPRIDEMSDRLSRFGWRAVCVDGFIPPRAFQAFQARGLLPIAADIRTAQHLKYTPAPDIIHEAAGHAPFLADPDFARYLRKIGEVAERSFAGRGDRDAYQAIYTLSEIKEDPAATAEQIDRAEQAVARAALDQGPASESARVARLYWWTAEYGLVGPPDDYRLYGAGLLSSLVEGRFCRDKAVRKIPLGPDCVDVNFDITRAQPQLFVARDFGQLEDVLEDVARTLSQRSGGRAALETARTSGEVATVGLDTGVQVIGVVHAFHQDPGSPEAGLVEFTGPCAIARAGRIIDGLPRAHGYLLPLGILDDGVALSALSAEALAARTDAAGNLTLTLQGGVDIKGHVGERVIDGGRALVAVLDGCTITRAGRVLFHSATPYPLALAGRVGAVAAGAPDGFFAPTRFPDTTVPHARMFAPPRREIIALHTRMMDAWQNLGGREITQTISEIAARLDAAYPDEWLLRWNLLERLVRLGERGAPADKLTAALEQLELRYHHVEPIATGLEHLRALIGQPGEPAPAEKSLS